MGWAGETVLQGQEEQLIRSLLLWAWGLVEDPLKGAG